MALSKAGLVTIGNAAAEDRKIIFDGNAQDWHIGIDDSADDLTIGLGSTLGTTSHIVIDEAGHVTMPLQSCFQAVVNPSADQADIALGSFVDIEFDNVDSAHTFLFIRFTTSNRNYDTLVHNPDHDLASDGSISLSGSFLVDMDAADTCKCTTEITSGTAQTDINGGNSYFMGYLVA